MKTARNIFKSIIGGAFVFGLTASVFAEAPPPRADLNITDNARIRAVTLPATDFSKPEAYEAMQGGATTLAGHHGRDVYTKPAPNLSPEALLNFNLGKALFEKFWVSSPSSTQASDGLGPLYNARSCHSCHLRNGRGEPPRDGDATSFVLRLARPAEGEESQKQIEKMGWVNLPDPVYGKQLQDFAVPGLQAEGKVQVSYGDVEVTMGDGTAVTLRKPSYRIAEPNYGPIDAKTTLSPRIAQPMIGLGLIEAIAPDDILAGADPDDKNGDGISGRAATTPEGNGHAQVLGLFGWKAQHATVRAQSAAALNTDIGISSPDEPASHGDCTSAEAKCLSMADGVQSRLGDSEAPDPVMELLTDYSSTLAVPARRDVGNPEVLEGKQQFYAAGCIACHRSKFVTRRDAARKESAFQLIWPYSDFLLHDMGEGLADGQQVGTADGREWRTPPLWGIGLSGVANGRRFFLHDGRARTLEEAILWHGGEAELSKDRYMKMKKKDRDALVRFLESL
ncbi:di-heme oxidoredictase family protein [Rhizobium sp. L1K21]|uniref:di-heme oxidoreductase family protein n=1 Tax=Rhizobium sp. L1K21 TaxID=2954933 RepID=UPI002092969A|nr:di-heme oxidoredictase family protein [Rhizobium sp. L1K21]MCO6187327.1 thiol oxidoreductase [Rhizobium sp. L1K21]